MMTVTDLVLQRNGRVLHPTLSFTLEKGQIWWVRGPNGSGKSTLLKALLGWIPQEGLPRSDDLTFAYLGHQPGLPGYLTVWQHAMTHPSLGPVDRDECHRALVTLGLNDLVDRHINRLSAGQKQRLAWLPLLLSKARIWLLDEPFTSLDTAGVLHAKTLLKEAAQREIAIMVVSHDDMSDTTTHILSMGGV